MVTNSKKNDENEDGEIVDDVVGPNNVIEINSSGDSRKTSFEDNNHSRNQARGNKKQKSNRRSRSREKRVRSNSKDRLKKRRRSRSRSRERREAAAERQRGSLEQQRNRNNRDNHQDRNRRRDAERRRRMSPSPTFKRGAVNKSPERRRSREVREKRRMERHKRKKSDVFKGTLSEGLNRRDNDSSDEELKDVEIPMDSDDEEAQIRKRREARQKMLQRLNKDDNSPASSPSHSLPLLDRIKEKNRVSSRDSASTPKRDDSDDDVDDNGIDDILAAALRDDLEGLNNEDLESALKEKLLENKHKSIDAKPITEDFWKTENDMFADSFSPGIKNNRYRLDHRRDSHNPILQDNWTDSEGYFRISVGELLDNRYKSYAFTGKGVFSNVIRCKDRTENDKDVAIKIIRKNELMHKAGLKEVDLLHKLNEADPDDRYHCLRMHRSFVFKQHLCLVFEPLAMNLRDVVKKYGSGVGLHVKAVRSYAQQLFLALKLLKKCQLLHADIKPDNILVNESKSVLKLCDFGSGTNAKDAEITPYLVSRFYRAPEIIMGCPYDYAIDMWSVAVSIFELATGKIMLPGRTNNHMLKLMQDFKGKFPNRMIRRAAAEIRQLHFNQDSDFLYVKKDKLSGADTIQTNSNVQKTKCMKSMLVPSSSSAEKVTPELQRKMSELCDLIEKCTVLDPSRRASINDCLSHPFIVEKLS